MSSFFIEAGDIICYDEATDEMDIQLIWWRLEEYCESENIDFDKERDINNIPE